MEHLGVSLGSLVTLSDSGPVRCSQSTHIRSFVSHPAPAVIQVSLIRIRGCPPFRDRPCSCSSSSFVVSVICPFFDTYLSIAPGAAPEGMAGQDCRIEIHSVCGGRARDHDHHSGVLQEEIARFRVIPGWGKTAGGRNRGNFISLIS